MWGLTSLWCLLLVSVLQLILSKLILFGGSPKWEQQIVVTFLSLNGREADVCPTPLLLVIECKRTTLQRDMLKSTEWRWKFRSYDIHFPLIYFDTAKDGLVRCYFKLSRFDSRFLVLLIRTDVYRFVVSWLLIFNASLSYATFSVIGVTFI